MKRCPLCNNSINENDNFCNICDTKVNLVEDKYKNNGKKKSYIVLAIIFTIIYLSIYIFNCWLWNGVRELGDGLSGGDVSSSSPLRELAGTCAVSMVFASAPWILSIIFSFASKRKGLTYFNSIFLIINILFLFFESYL